jgi:hypothetical protein
MNVLVWLVFPCMSKRHVQKYRACGGCRVLPQDEIWQNAQNVWNELPNSKVASAYFHAYRIVDKVIQAKGDNKFIDSGGHIVGSETISNEPKMVLNELRRRRLVLPIISSVTMLLF